MTAAAAALYADATERGLGDPAFFATLEALEQAAGVQVPKVKG